MWLSPAPLGPFSFLPNVVSYQLCYYPNYVTYAHFPYGKSAYFAFHRLWAPFPYGKWDRRMGKARLMLRIPPSLRQHYVQPLFPIGKGFSPTTREMGGATRTPFGVKRKARKSHFPIGKGFSPTRREKAFGISRREKRSVAFSFLPRRGYWLTPQGKWGYW